MLGSPSMGSRSSIGADKGVWVRKVVGVNCNGGSGMGKDEQLGEKKR